MEKDKMKNSNDVLSERGELDGQIELLPIQEWFMKNGMKKKYMKN